MNRVLRVCAAALPLVIVTAGPALADVKTRDRTQAKFEGMLGRMVGMFGGKAAREGVVTTVAVKGDRKAELSDAFGRIVDLEEEKFQDSQQSSGGGLGGMLARKMMKTDSRPRATVLTLTHETLEVTPAVAAEDVQLPAGFKEKK